MAPPTTTASSTPSNPPSSSRPSPSTSSPSPPPPTAPAPLGVHLIGSLSGSTTAYAAMSAMLSSYPSRLRRLPDGEPAARGSFIAWQRDVFARAAPEVLRQYDSGFNCVPLPAVSQEEVDRVVKGMMMGTGEEGEREQDGGLKTGYDDAALSSYAAFTQLHAAGKIPPHTRFQVCIPTPTAVMCLVRPEYQLAIEPLYTSALLSALRRIQAEIPHAQLAIQIDVAAETLTLEGLRRGDERCWWPHFAPYWGAPHFEGVVERIVRVVDAVESDVQVGFHVCHGDWRNAHFVEPADLGLAVEIANAVTQAARREVDWWHLPVPKERSDGAYFAPLRALDVGRAELFLGLVHAEDEEGTWRRLRAAREVLGEEREVGVASECGLGRTPADKLQSIAEISTKVSMPVV
ncbi:hypothetical protein IWZ01DRAFT_524649 [Phyllosticta capitalensis]